MRRPRDVAFYLAAALSGIAAAYILVEWLWPASDGDEPPPDAEPPAKSLPPLRTHSLPALLSGPSGPITPPTFTDTEGTDNEDDNSFVDIMSPSPSHVISRRRSMRAHDLFAESHISFSDLGNLVAPQNEPE